MNKELLAAFLANPKQAPIPENIREHIELVVVLAEWVTVETLPIVYLYIQRLPLIQQSSFWTLVTRRNEGDLTYSKELKEWIQNNRSLFDKSQL